MKMIIKPLVFLLFIFLIILYGFRYFVVPNVIKHHHILIDFNHIEFPSSPNFYYSPEKKSIFNMPIKQLEQKWDFMISKQPRVTEIFLTKNREQRVYVQLSAFWNFPDFIDIKFIPLSKNKSGITLYSRSHFGYSDFGVNKKRVKHWLSLI